MIREIAKKLTGIFNDLLRAQRDNATGILAFEITEMENIFMLLIMGGLIGLPSPPTIYAIELLPYLENELRVMIARNHLAQDPMGMLMAVIGSE